MKPCSADMSDSLISITYSGDYDDLLRRCHFGSRWKIGSLFEGDPQNFCPLPPSQFFFPVVISFETGCHPALPEFQCYRVSWAMPPSSSRSKAKSRPLPRAAFEDAPSDDSSSQDKRRPMPKMRPLLGPFIMILGG